MKLLCVGTNFDIVWFKSKNLSKKFWRIRTTPITEFTDDLQNEIYFKYFLKIKFEEFQPLSQTFESMLQVGLGYTPQLNFKDSLLHDHSQCFSKFSNVVT